MTPNELDLRQTLQEDASRIDATGDFATAAIGLERRRTRRRTTLTAAAAALAAVVVPFLFWSPNGPTGGLAPATSPSASVSPTPSATGSATPTPSMTRSADPVPTTPTAPTTEAPSTNVPVTATAQNTYALDDTIVVEGRVITLDRGTVVNRFSVLSNGGFVLESQLGSKPTELEILSPAGRTITTVSRQGGSYVASRDGSIVVAETRFEGPVVVLSPDGTELARRSGAGSPVAVVGEYVYLGGQSAEHTTEWNYLTGETRKLPRYITAVSTDRRVAALDRPLNDGYDTCWAVVDLTQASFPMVREHCGRQGNPQIFRPREFSADGTYLVGEKYIDGGYWFIPAVYRVSDGTDMLGGTPEKPIAGWSWRLDDDGTSIVISRDTAPDVTVDPAMNTLQRCTLAMACTTLQQELPLTDSLGMQPRYIVPR
ncbi:hypothetical protein [Intrasporangium sp.]|uniref:hypothetical protein n=1 Tax=Intrasporangium sp. TaxID=1925024 RepID=UPI0033656B6D